MTTLISKREDIQWLIDTHLPVMSGRLFELDKRPYFAEILGNEDAPEKVNIFDKNDYRATPMAVFRQDEYGNLQRFFKDISLKDISENIPDGDYRITDTEMFTKTYQVRNGTWYNGETNPEVIRVLENARNYKKTIRIDLGYGQTGESWSEENDTLGTIGRSSGKLKVPLLIEEGDNGGPHVMDHCIVGIMTEGGKKTLWRHPDYKPKYDWESADIRMSTNFDAVMNHKEQPFKVFASLTGAAEKIYVAGFDSLSESEKWLGDKRKFEPQGKEIEQPADSGPGRH